MTPPHTPTPTSPPNATTPPMESGGRAGHTHSSRSCESGPGQSPPSEPGPPAPQVVSGELPPPAGRGGWMPQVAWEAMLADALHPHGVQPHSLPAPQDHPYVLKRLRETLQETRREGRRLWDITRSPTPRTHIPWPPHKHQHTDIGSTRSTAGTPSATQHGAPDPPASGDRSLTLRGDTPWAAPRPHAEDTPCQPNSPRTRPSRADDSRPASRQSRLGADPAP